jgi:uncharacterized protein (TIGR02231 family)
MLLGFLGLLFLSFSTVSAIGEEKKFKTTVSGVTIYGDRALITRSGLENVAAGLQTLVIDNLPVSLVDQSLRVEGEAEDKAKIIDVKIETVYLDTIPEGRVKSLQDRLKGLRAEERNVIDRLQVLKIQKDYLDSLRMYSARDAKLIVGPKSTYDDWERMLSFLDRKLTSLFSEMRTVAVSLEEIRNKIRSIEAQIRQAEAYSKKSIKRASIDVEIVKSGAVRLRISYLLYGTGWTPLYETRVSSGATEMQMTYTGMVRQSTGEDWNQIDLVLSTAKPSVGGALPELNPWFVDMRVPSLPRYSMGRSDGVAKSMAAPSPGLVAPETESAPEPPRAYASSIMRSDAAEVETQATSSVYRISQKMSIPSDNNPHRVPIAVVSLPVKLDYSCVPKMAELVYLQGKITNGSDYTLLAGSMNVFFENNFVAVSGLKNVFPGEEFPTALGVDEGVRVQRKLLNRVTEYKGTFSKTTRINYDVLITVENQKRVPIHIEIKDNVPLSRNEKIVVEVTDPDPKVMTPEEQGLFVWRLDLSPAEKKEIKLTFSVEYPRDMIVTGLE